MLNIQAKLKTGSMLQLYACNIKTVREISRRYVQCRPTCHSPTSHGTVRCSGSLTCLTHPLVMVSLSQFRPRQMFNRLVSYTPVRCLSVPPPPDETSVKLSTQDRLLLAQKKKEAKRAVKIIKQREHLSRVEVVKLS